MGICCPPRKYTGEGKLAQGLAKRRTAHFFGFIFRHQDAAVVCSVSMPFCTGSGQLWWGSRDMLHTGIEVLSYQQKLSTYAKNNRSPRIDPWETPLLITLGWLIMSSTTYMHLSALENWTYSGSVPAPPVVFLYWRLLEAIFLEALERFLEVIGDQMLRLLNYDYAVYKQI